MQLSLPIHVSFRYVVDLQNPPLSGDAYRDPRGHKWYVRGSRRALPVLTDPPKFTRWEITLEADHPAYRIEPGETLIPVWTTRASPERGYVDHDEGVGFGDCERLTRRCSWLYRELGDHYTFEVGPMVARMNEFSDAEFSREGPLPKRDPEAMWPRIRDGLRTFFIGLPEAETFRDA